MLLEHYRKVLQKIFNHPTIALRFLLQVVTSLMLNWLLKNSASLCCKRLLTFDILNFITFSIWFQHILSFILLGTFEFHFRVQPSFLLRGIERRQQQQQHLNNKLAAGRANIGF